MDDLELDLLVVEADWKLESSMDIELVVRDADEYERNHLKISDPFIMGYYSLKHNDKEEFLNAVLTTFPGTIIDPNSRSWQGRWETNQYDYNDPMYRHLARVRPYEPTVSDVVHTHWRMVGVRKDGRIVQYFNRARPNSRGSFAVTYLPIEGGGGERDLAEIWDGNPRS